MQRFRRIAVPEGDSPLLRSIDRFQRYSERPIVVYRDNADSEAKLIKRINGADCVLIGWGSRLSRNAIAACGDLTYVGLAATLFSGPGSNIDLEAAAERNITVSGVSDYGDIGVVEFVVGEIIRHIKYGETNTELASHCVGVVGAGATGSKVAHALRTLGATVYYTSRTPKGHLDGAGIGRLALGELLRVADVVTLHVPRNTRLLGAEELGLFTGGKLLINTSLGLPVETDVMERWLTDRTNRFVADADGAGDIVGSAAGRDNVHLYPGYVGFTREAHARLVDKVEQNITAFLNRRASQ